MQSHRLRWTLILFLCQWFLTTVTEAQLGLLCAKDSDCKMSSSFMCGPKKSCVCQRGYKFDILKLGCSKYVVGHRDKCDPLRDVCVGGPNAICISNFLGERAVCQCKSGHVFDDKTKLCQSNEEFIQSNGPNSNNNHISSSNNNNNQQQQQAGVETGVPPGGFCSSNKECRGFPNATCYSYVNTGKRECDCTYDTHYYEMKVKTCLPKKDYAAPCDMSEQCVNIQNIECAASASNSKKSFKTCTCKTNFYFDKKQQRCVPAMNIGDNCSHDSQCRARPHSYCSGQGNKGGVLKCACLPGKEFFGAAGTCVDTAGKIKPGQPCKNSEQCVANANCLSIFLGQVGPVCNCKDGFEFDEGSMSCLTKGDKPPSVVNNENNNNYPSSNDSPNMSSNINLKFDINIKVSCDSVGKCKTLNSTVVQSQ